MKNPVLYLETGSPRKMLIWLRKTVKYLESKQTK